MLGREFQKEELTAVFNMNLVRWAKDLISKFQLLLPEPIHFIHG
jgi:hypothetical protein